jgi:hypothetical protein
MTLNLMTMLLVAAAPTSAPGNAPGHPELPFRPPAAPLVTHDPYLSIWSPADRLTDAPTMHWTGAVQPLSSLVRVDGVSYRLMGTEPEGTAALPQVGLEVWPTRTLCRFEGAGIELELQFMSPLIPNDLDLYARPVTTLTWTARSADGVAHEVSVYFDAPGLLCVNEPDQAVVWAEERLGGAAVLRLSAAEQRVLGRSGDNLRIEWGDLYVAPSRPGAAIALGEGAALRARFIESGPWEGLPVDEDQPRPAGQRPVVAAVARDLGAVGSAEVSDSVVIAYDDHYGMQYFGRNLRPFWRRDGADAASLIADALRDSAQVAARCEAFDRELVADLERSGGAKYAAICALAFRQSLAACKLVADSAGRPLFFSKENFSNGCTGTVDVFYPQSPILLLTSPTLMEATVVPVLEYAASDLWPFPFAPHDIGQYPLANGQVYGGGATSEENQMPVEESGNMLILLAALSKARGNTAVVDRYWPMLEEWAEYLLAKGLDPEHQLCTDDFAGHLAHNVNLSAKATMGIRCFAELCHMRGDAAQASRYRAVAVEYAREWRRRADDGDHYRLAFDRPGTWSQKYNLVWDRVLGFDLFPRSIARTEMDYYLQAQNEYGLPLDNRQDYTKLDWILWTATLTGDQEDFDALVDPVWRFLNDTPDRVPMTDWFRTEEPRAQAFRARPVVGGVFLKALYDGALWAKWANRDSWPKGEWAPLPAPAEVVVATAREAETVWRYTTEDPGEGWSEPGFDDSSWSEGPAGFGSPGTPGGVVRTEWRTSDIWIRRTVTLQAPVPDDLQLLLHHDEDAEVYINGALAARVEGYQTRYVAQPILAEARRGLRAGDNLMAIHCHQTWGGQYIDAGLCRLP